MDSIVCVYDPLARGPWGKERPLRYRLQTEVNDMKQVDNHLSNKGLYRGGDSALTA